MVTLDIGCGSNKVKGSIGVDVVHVSGVDVVGSISSLPFTANSVDIVYLSHVLEHMPSLIETVEEIWRVAKDRARIYVWGPHFSCGLYTWSDPTHRRAFSSTTFDYFDPSSSMSYYSKARFRVLRRELHFGFRREVNIVSGFSLATTRAKILLARVFEPLANRSRMSQLLCERTWGTWLGFEEVFIELEAVKRR